MDKPSVCVLGAGSWGTALAIVLSAQGRQVCLLARDTGKASRMQQARENSAYLPGMNFPDSLTVTADLDEAIADSAAAVIALPCAVAEDYVKRLSQNYAGPMIAACKGLHPETLQRTDEMLANHVGENQIAILSGPSFAPEVARGLPTAITMAARDVDLASQAASLFDDTSLRVYTCTDVVGVTLGGALKNVVAIAAGIATGLQLGHNATAALITRGLPEISRLACACGANAETIHGLSGLGDLVLTCTGDLSRNRRFGMALAQGMDVKSAKQHIGQTAEGVRTAEAAYKLATRHNIDIPIMQAVYEVISGQATPMDAVQSLLARPSKSEY